MADKVIGRAMYKGKVYGLLFQGDTRFGYRARLQFLDGSSSFWVNGNLVRRLNPRDVGPTDAAKEAPAPVVKPEPKEDPLWVLKIEVAKYPNEAIKLAEAILRQRAVKPAPVTEECGKCGGGCVGTCKAAPVTDADTFDLNTDDDPYNGDPEGYEAEIRNGEDSEEIPF